MSSIRTLHPTKAVKKVEATMSIVTLAELEAEELVGGEHRPSVGAAFRKVVAALVSVGITEDERVEVGLHLEGKTGSIILAALEGDSHSDDDTGPGEIREGGGSPSEAADPKPSTQPRAKASSESRRIVGRLVRVRTRDGSHVVTSMGEARRRSG